MKYHGCKCSGSLHCQDISEYDTGYVGYRESIMSDSAERSSPEWVCIPEITSDSEWFLWNTNSWEWTLFRTGAHDQLYFLHNVFPCDNLTKHRKSLSNHWTSLSEAGNHSWVLKKNLSLFSLGKRYQLPTSSPLWEMIEKALHVSSWIHHNKVLTRCSLVTLYGTIVLGQHLFR